VPQPALPEVPGGLHPSAFYQTFKGELQRTEIPYDLVDDFVPELLRDPDLNLQHLAAVGPGQVGGFGDILGDSQAIRLAVGRAQRAALRDVPVLLLGESGTGKELFARAIHDASRRRAGPFVPVNCAAIPRDLLESELFGHEKGSFTGAARRRVGAFERAEGGTLFLDEVGDCDPAMQAKLLRVLQPPPGKGPCHREFYRVGAEKPSAADVRVLAATNRDLVRAEEHPEPGYGDKRLSASAIAFVKSYPWPGNVRQLQNALLQAAVMADGDTIERGDVAAAVGNLELASPANVLEQPLGDGFGLEEHLKSIQSHYLRRAMGESRGVKAEAARLLGYENYQTLAAQLKRLEVRWAVPADE
jgi:transcriptional regulator with GAF, ATPase, and Fis domain